MFEWITMGLMAWLVALGLNHPLAQFSVVGWLAYIPIRYLADYAKIRWYIPQKNHARIHMHHYKFGLILMLPTMWALWEHAWFAPSLAAILSALIFSEIVELMTGKWKK